MWSQKRIMRLNRNRKGQRKGKRTEMRPVIIHFPNFQSEFKSVVYLAWNPVHIFR